MQRLHSNPLDLTKPLWEAHLIEGLADNRFAFYFKAHHCAVDGMGAVNVIKHWLTTAPLAAGALADVPQLQDLDDNRRVVDSLARTTLARAGEGCRRSVKWAPSWRA